MGCCVLLMVSPVRSDSVAHEPVTQKFGHPHLRPREYALGVSFDFWPSQTESVISEAVRVAESDHLFHDRSARHMHHACICILRGGVSQCLVPEFAYAPLRALDSARTITPAPINEIPNHAWPEGRSPRKITAKSTTRTTLSLSIGATKEASPSCRALK